MDDNADTSYKIHFEYLGEDQDFPGSKTWRVEAIHVTTTRNRRKFTQAELEAAGRSLSFRPLNINHEKNRQLPFPENSTLNMDFSPEEMAVVGRFRVSDPAVNAMIETGRITTVSIEQIPMRGETCNEIQCEQHGVAFIGMALLEAHVLPGDSLDVRIKPESAAGTTQSDGKHTLMYNGQTWFNIGKKPFVEKLADLFVSDQQRTCVGCNDFVMCESCTHKEQDKDCVAKWIKKLSDEDKSRPRDQIIAMAFSKCRKGEGASKEEAWEFYKMGREAWDREILGKTKKPTLTELFIQ